MERFNFTCDVNEGIFFHGRNIDTVFDGTNAYSTTDTANVVRSVLRSDKKVNQAMNLHGIDYSSNQAIEFARTTGIDPASNLLTLVLPNNTVITKYIENMNELYGNTLMVGMGEDATYLTGYTIEANSLDPREYQVSNNSDYKELGITTSTNPSKVASYGVRVKTYYLERLLFNKAQINAMQMKVQEQMSLLMQALSVSMWWGGKETGNYGLMTHPEIVTSTTLGNTKLSGLNETQFQAKIGEILTESITNLKNNTLTMLTGLPTLYISNLEKIQLSLKTMSIQTSATNQTYLAYLQQFFDVKATPLLDATNNAFNKLGKEYYVVEFAKEAMHGITRQIPMLPRVAGSIDTDGQIDIQDACARSGGVVVGDGTATRIFVQQ